jgi:ABC-type amino acid transport substrate-binding protein
VAYSHEGEPIYVAFAKNEQGRRFSEIFDVGLREMRANGKLAALLKRYSLVDWK